MSEAKFKFGDRVWHEVNGEGVVTFAGESGVRIAWQEKGQEDSFFTQPAKSLTHYTPPSLPNTVPVRIAVAVGGDGSWEVRPINGIEDEESARMFAADDLLDGQPRFCRVSIITAHVPLPEQPAEVEGRVDG